MVENCITCKAELRAGISQTEKNPNRAFISCPNKCKNTFRWLSGEGAVMATPSITITPDRPLSKITTRLCDDACKPVFSMTSFGGQSVAAPQQPEDPTSMFMVCHTIQCLITSINALVEEMSRSNNLNNNNMVRLTNNFLTLSKRVESLERDILERDDMNEEIASANQSTIAHK
jgi:hypothetical protein